MEKFQYNSPEEMLEDILNELPQPQDVSSFVSFEILATLYFVLTIIAWFRVVPNIIRNRERLIPRLLSTFLRFLSAYFIAFLASFLLLLIRIYEDEIIDLIMKVVESVTG